MNFPRQRSRETIDFSDDRFYFLLLLGLALLVALFMGQLILDLHKNFLTTECDTAAFQSAIVNSMHGKWFRDTAFDGPNLLGLHTTFVLLLVAPLYALYPSPDFLTVLQLACVYSTVIPLYFVALEMLKKPAAAFAVAGTALVSPFFQNLAFAPFHPETWIAAAVLWSYFFYLRRNTIGFWVSFGLAVICGEQAALIYLALGVALFAFDDGLAWRRTYGLWALAGGIGWLLLATLVIFPLMRAPGQHNLIAYHFANWKIQSLPELPLAVMKDPLAAIQDLFSLSRWTHLLALVGAPLLLAPFSWRSLVLLAVFPPYFLMSEQEFYLLFHAYFFQFAWLAGCFGLIALLRRWEIGGRAGLTIISITLLLNALLLCASYGTYAVVNGENEDAVNAQVRSALALIPKEAGVYGPHRYSEFLSDRQNMVMGDLAESNLDFKAMLDSRFATTDVHPEEIDYIVCDFVNDQCGWRRAGYDPNDMRQRKQNVNALLKSGEWQLCYRNFDIAILKRANK